jgi:hypothetical protein
VRKLIVDFRNLAKAPENNRFYVPLSVNPTELPSCVISITTHCGATGHFLYLGARKINMTANIRKTLHCGAFTKPLLLWKSNNYYLLVCVCMLARACVHVGTRARGRVHAHTCI